MSPEQFEQYKQTIESARSSLSSMPSDIVTEATHPEHEKFNNNLLETAFMQTPCKQVAKLNLNDICSGSKDAETKNKKTKSKLLGSKSLSQLVSKMSRNHRSTDEDKKQQTKKSSMNRKTQSATMVRPNLDCQDMHHYRKQLRKMKLSPITKPKGVTIRDIVAQTPALPLNRNRESTIDCRLRVDSTTENGDEASKERATKEQKDTKFKPFQNTALVLRDVKNSVRLRFRAKRDNQEFEKLTNESMATPETKLYSPFNIYTPGQKIGSESKSPANTTKRGPKKSKKRLYLDGDEKDDATNDSGKAGKLGKSEVNSMKNLKSKIALRHKKHLMQSNKLSFDSPTGRFRETVKDVEQLQQCIEDISEAIKARRSNTCLLDD